MFEKREYRMYKGVKREHIYQQVCDFWARSGFYVSQISPFQIQGQSYYQKIGLKREFSLRMDEQEDTTYIDLTLNANHQKRNIGFLDQYFEPVGNSFQNSVGFLVDQMVKIIQDHQLHFTSLDKVDQARVH